MDLYEIVLGIEKQRVRQALTGRLTPWYCCLPALMLGIGVAVTLDCRLFSFVPGEDGCHVMPTLRFVGWAFAFVCVCVCWFLVRHVHSASHRMVLGLCIWCLGWGLLGYFSGAPSPRLLAPTDVRCEIEANAVTGRLPGELNAIVEVRAWTCDAKTRETGRFLAKMPIRENDSIERGDTFVTKGTFRRPMAADTPGAFDAKRRLHEQGISLEFRRYSRFEDGQQILSPIIRIDQDHQSLRRWIDRQRLSSYDSLRPYSEYGILPALSLGVSKTLDQDTRQTFATLGIAHVLAVSGLHFGLIAAALTWVMARLVSRSPYIMRRMGRKRATMLFSALFLWLYILIVGAPVSAQRAMIMMYACMLGHLCGRKPESFRNLSLAGIFILILDPHALFSAGFQLSFGAVLGIFCSNDLVQAPLKLWFKKHVRRERLRHWLQGMVTVLVMTIGATLVTAPVSIWHFGQLPLLGMLTNLVVIPFVSFILLPLSLLATLLAGVEPVGSFVGIMAGYAEYGCVHAMSWVAAHIPLSCVKLPPHPMVMLVFSGVALMTIAGKWASPWRKRLTRTTAVAAAIVLLISVISPTFWTSPAGVRMTFIAMGQADATLLEFPDGTRMLVDAGNAVGSTYDMGNARILPYLRSHGIDHIHYLVLTHPDHDHYAAMESIIKNVSVGEFWFNGEHAQEPAYCQLLDALQAHGIPTINVQETPALHEFGDASLIRLWPEDALISQETSRNARSLVFRLQYGQYTALLMGDAGFEVEEKLAERYGMQLDSTLLKAGHHGSRFATSDAWLELTRPEFVVFSAGINNRYHFPSHETTRRCAAHGAQMFSTDSAGTIRVTTNGQKVTIETAW